MAVGVAANHEQIVGLEVAVDHAFVVGLGQRQQCLPHDLDRIGWGDAAEPLDAGAERLAFEQLHGQKHRAVDVVRIVAFDADFAEVEHRDGVRRGQQTGGVGLLLKAALRLLVDESVGADDLERHVAAGSLLVRPVHRPHRAGPQQLEDGEALADHHAEERVAIGFSKGATRNHHPVGVVGTPEQTSPSGLILGVSTPRADHPIASLWPVTLFGSWTCHAV